MRGLEELKPLEVMDHPQGHPSRESGEEHRALEHKRGVVPTEAFQESCWKGARARPQNQILYHLENSLLSVAPWVVFFHIFYLCFHGD